MPIHQITGLYQITLDLFILIDSQKLVFKEAYFSHSEHLSCIELADEIGEV
jgi:hypothetical protein